MQQQTERSHGCSQLLTRSALLEANRDFCSRLSRRRLLACGSSETEQAEWPLDRDCCSPGQRSSRAGSIALVVDAATAPPEANSHSAAEPRASGPAPTLTRVRGCVKREGGTACARAAGTLWRATWILRTTRRRHCWERVRVRRSASDTVAELRVSPAGSYGGLLLRHGGRRE